MLRILIPSILLLTACTATRVTEKAHATDTLRILRIDTLRATSTFRDSIYLRDSIYIQGNTIVKERTRHRDRIRTDTLYRDRWNTRTQYRDREVFKEVGRKPTFKEKIEKLAEALIAISIAFGAGWLFKKRNRG